MDGSRFVALRTQTFAALEEICVGNGSSIYLLYKFQVVLLLKCLFPFLGIPYTPSMHDWDVDTSADLANLL